MHNGLRRGLPQTLKSKPQALNGPKLRTEIDEQPSTLRLKEGLDL